MSCDETVNVEKKSIKFFSLLLLLFHHVFSIRIKYINCGDFLKKFHYPFSSPHNAIHFFSVNRYIIIPALRKCGQKTLLQIYYKLNSLINFNNFSVFHEVRYMVCVVI